MTKYTSLFQILVQSLTIFICLVKCLFVPNIEKILMNLNFLYYPRPMYPGRMDIHSFAQFWTVLQNPKMKTCWPPNRGTLRQAHIRILLCHFYLTSFLKKNIQTASLLIKVFILFLSQLYGAATPKGLQIALPVIK